MSHVDDLLFGGDSVAEKSLRDVGDELGFRELEKDVFTWCGKQFTREPDGTVSFSMRNYHENLKEILVPKYRKSDLLAPVTAYEHKQLRALLGSFPWLVAQVRFDMAFTVSSLQGETPTVGTLIRANQRLLSSRGTLALR